MSGRGTGGAIVAAALMIIGGLFGLFEGLDLSGSMSGQAQSGDPIAIAEYLGTDDTFDNAIADFSARYADQNQRDYDTFVKAIADGRIQAVTGI